MFTSSTFSTQSAFSNPSSAASISASDFHENKPSSSSCALTTYEKPATEAQLEEIQKILEFIRQAAKNGTKPDRSWIWNETAQWPLEYVWDSVSTFYPIPAEDTLRQFEHALEKNGRPTTYSKWYFKWAIQKWEEGMEVKMVWDEGIFTKKMWHSRWWLERREEEDVGPMGERC